jgi:hypothetical protein
MRRHHFVPKPLDAWSCAEDGCDYSPEYFVHKPPSEGFLLRMQRSTRRAMKLDDDLEVLPGLTDQQRYAVSVTVRDLAQKFHTEYLKAKKTREEW